MKIIFIFIIFIFFTFFCIGQKKVRGYVSLEQNFNFSFDYNCETNFNFGVTYPLKNSNLTLIGSYYFGGNINNRNLTESYRLTYHLLGGGIKYRIGAIHKFYHPALRVNLSTQFATNYKGGNLDEISDEGKARFYPNTTSSYPIYKTNYQPYSQTLVGHYAYYYVSSPLLGSIFFDNEFKLFDDFYFSVSIGYLFRAYQYQKVSWSLNEPKPALNTKTINFTTLYNHHLEFAIGLNYTFDFK